MVWSKVLKKKKLLNLHAQHNIHPELQFHQSPSAANHFVSLCLNSALLWEMDDALFPYWIGKEIWSLQNWISQGLICVYTLYVYGVFTMSVCVAGLLWVCVPGASIRPSKQSWQANLIWPGKGQPHSNCLSLTLCTDGPLLSLFVTFLVIPPFLNISPSFLYHHVYSFKFHPPILSPFHHSSLFLTVCSLLIF